MPLPALGPKQACIIVPTPGRKILRVRNNIARSGDTECINSGGHRFIGIGIIKQKNVNNFCLKNTIFN